MNKFWNWMESKNYCNDKGFSFWEDPVLEKDHYYPLGEKKQMLVGYMIEYLEEHNMEFDINFGIGIENWYSALSLYIEGKIEVVK